jgi:LytS/YehU family sensor histidine kinase
MNLAFEKDQLLFTVANSIDNQNINGIEIMNYKGIGLKNVQRRLDLMYPHQHQLTIEQDNNQFRIVLYLNLHAQKHPASVMALEAD